MNIQTCLLKEYKQHPSFRFGDASLRLDGLLEAEFNNTYQNLWRYTQHLPTGAFTRVAARCMDQLDQLFVTLRDQTKNPMEVAFLDELLVKVGQLLRAEIGFVRLRTGRRTNWLADTGALSHADTLARNRHLFGCLSPDALEEINELAEPAVSRLRASSDAGACTRDELSVTQGSIIRRICGVLNRFFDQQGILDAVSAYMGCRMTVSGAALELSLPQTGWWNNRLGDLAVPPRTLYAHLDESVDHPKSIVYLNDVSESQGPTCVYPQAYESLGVTPLQELVGRIVGTVGLSTSSPLYGYYAREYHQSMSSENFRRHYMRLPDAMKFNSHFGWDVLPGGEVEQYLVGQEKKMVGPAGTFVVFDGARFLHRGGLIDSGERIALQVIFSDAHLGRKIARKIKKKW